MIVQAANGIIKNNKDQIKKDVWTDNPDGKKIKVIKSLSDNEEGKQIANSIFENKQNYNLKNEDFAILYRTNAQSRSFEEALRRLNIPYKIYGGLSFYQRKEIKDLLAYFRLSANNNDEEAFKRIINYPKRGIGSTTVDHLIVKANEEQTSLWNIASNLDKYQLAINAGAQKKISDFVTMINSFNVRLNNTPAYDLAKDIASSSGMTKTLYDDKTPEGVSRYENIQELLNGIKEFTEKNTTEESITTLPDFLIDVALLTDADNDKPEDQDKVVLMTIHSAKGLEFPYVYIVGLEENLFPSQLSLNSRTELEEERRLFYVAITRAEKSLTLSYATTRYKWGSLTTSEPSRFIEEIDEKYLDNQFATLPKSSPKEGAFKMKFSSPSPSPKNLKKVTNTAPSAGTNTDDKNYVVGIKVAHAKFGQGKIINIEGAYPNRKATVFFPNVGQKQLLLKFAKLEIVE